MIVRNDNREGPQQRAGSYFTKIYVVLSPKTKTQLNVGKVEIVIAGMYESVLIRFMALRL